MKRIVSCILLLCMALTMAACAAQGGTLPEDTTVESATTESATTESATTESATTENATTESTTPEITLQEVYDAGKDYAALLGDHESVYIHVTSNGKAVYEVYLSKQYYYSFYSAEYMDMGFEYAALMTDHSEYVFFDNLYTRNVTLNPDGLVDMTNSLAMVGMLGFISSEMPEHDTATISEQDGSIIVSYTADAEDLLIIGERVISCVETYTLDATTREMTSVKTVYTYEDGTVEEGIATVTRDVEAPEGVKPFLAYEQETENMRAVTIVSNPGTENEKTESVQVPKGMQVSLSPYWDVEETMNLYADAACTQIIEGELDANTDLTLYVKWGE